MAVPRPWGSPAPSGAMLISQGAMSAGAMGCPNCGACARAGAAKNIPAKSARRLSIDIGQLALFIDAPACNCIVMIGAAQAALRDKGCARRLHHTRVVGSATLQHCRAAIPLPWRAKAHRRLGQDRA